MGSLLHWAIIFLVVAVIAAFLGFGGVAGTAASGAQLLIYGAIALLVIGALVGLLRRAK
jgi:MYXO-CTERM domain-containing protein